MSVHPARRAPASVPAPRTKRRGARLLAVAAVAALTAATGLLAAGPAAAAGTSAIGDRVWNDLNMNGVQNPGEPGIPGVAVTLQRDVAGAWVDTASTTTSASGSYRFTELEAGTYRVQFALQEGMVFTLFRAGSGGLAFASDSDVQDPATGLTPAIVLEDGQINNTIDAGMYALPLTLTKEVVGTPVVAPDRTATVTYELTVTNTGPNPGRYDLSDRLGVTSVVTVTDVRAESTDPTDLPLSTTFDGVDDTTLLTAQAIDGGATHRVRVVVDVALPWGVDPTLGSCEVFDPEVPVGYSNTAALTSFGTTLEASACAPVVVPTPPPAAFSLTKELLDPDGLLPDGRFTIWYDVYEPGNDAVSGYEVTLEPGETRVITGLTVGTMIGVHEPVEDLPALPVGYAWNTPAIAPDGLVELDQECVSEGCEDEATPIVVTNSYTSREPTPTDGGTTPTDGGTSPTDGGTAPSGGGATTGGAAPSGTSTSAAPGGTGSLPALGVGLGALGVAGLLVVTGGVLVQRRRAAA